MNGIYRISRIAIQVFFSFVFITPVLYAADYSGLVSEDYLRTQFAFRDGDTLKYAECKKKSYPICTYVWGAKSKKDAIKKKYGQLPDGNRLQITYAQAKSQKDFQRVQSQYKDGVNVEGTGTAAVWSAKRSQLSFITKKNLVVHIYIDEKAADNLRAKAISIAGNILEQL